MAKSSDSSKSSYNESSIKSLDWRDHIRLRPGMYIGKLGNGSAPDDGIYVLFKEVVDNAIDEFIMGEGKRIDIDINGEEIEIRDYGRGIPLGKIVDCVAQINTGGKYAGEAFKKSVGLNGVGTKAVNALSAKFFVQAFRDGKSAWAEFSAGKLKQEQKPKAAAGENGTLIRFSPDTQFFPKYKWQPEFIEERLWNYVYLNAGLTIRFNGQDYVSKNGLLDLLKRHTDDTIRYPIIHFKEDDLEAALTHDGSYGERYFSFVNGQYTTEGGTHLAAFREGVLKACRDFYKKDFEPSDVRASIVGAVCARLHEPIFESQTKTKLGSTHVVGSDGLTVRAWVMEFIRKNLELHLHKHPDTAKALLERIQQNERERKEMAGIRRLANDRAKKANLHNRKLRDCSVHFDTNHKEREKTQLFITEGDSASGSITKARNPSFQGVFSLKGKPLNCFGMSKKVVYENEEFNLLQHALNIEEGVEGLRYNQIIVATDADVDGMHIRMLLLTFFLQFFPDLIERGHVHILQTPLFRVRTKKETIYCYDESEKQAALDKLGRNSEITRFKGLGEISPDEFKGFINENMRLAPVIIKSGTRLQEMLLFYMGKNTPERRDFIMNHLRIEDDVVTDDAGYPLKKQMSPELEEA